MTHTITVYSGDDLRVGNADLAAYYALRQKTFREKFDSPAFDHYPDAYDRRADTHVLIFKAPDPVTGEPVVFGGVRIVFPDRGQIGSLSVETKHTVRDPATLGKFTALRSNPTLDVTQIIPAIGAGVPLRYAEIGGLVADADEMARLFAPKDALATMRALMGHECLDIARDLGIDTLILGSHPKNRAHMKEWWSADTGYEFRQLGALKHLFTNPFPPGQEAELLLVNLSGKYPLHGANSILRPARPAQAAR